MIPHRHRTGIPRPACVLDPAHMALAVAEIVRRVRAHQRAGKGSTFVYIDPELRVYTIHEQHLAAREWAADLKGRWRWLVGVYSAGSRVAGLCATAEGVTEDVTEHLADLRRLA